MKPLLPTDLLERYNAGKASAEEIRRVEQWYESYEGEDSDLDQLSSEEKEQLGRRLYQALPVPPTESVRAPVLNWRRALSIASGIAAVVFISFLFWTYKGHPSRPLTYGNTLKELKRVDLPDGSQIWLYPQATLDLDEDFGEQTRSLRLKGTAFFQIKRDENRPFKIYSKGLITQVLGTSFLIDASPAKSKVEVSVLTGKVRLQEDQSKTYLVVRPQQKVYYQKGKEPKVYKTPEKDVSSVWKKEDFDFNNTPLVEVIQALAQRYGVVFQTENDRMDQCRLTAHFSQQNLPDMLEMISKSLTITYELEGSHVFFKGQGCSSY